MLGRKCLELPKCASGFEGFGIQLDRCVCREYPRASASRLLGMPGVRRTIRSQEEARVAARDSLEERAAIRLGLEHRQTIVMRPDSPGKQRVPIHQEVLRRN